MDKIQVYREVEFLNGDKCQILLPNFADYSAVMRKYQDQAKLNLPEGELDVFPFFMERLCLFNGQKKDLKFVLKLSGDIYYKIVPIFTELMDTAF